MRRSEMKEELLTKQSRATEKHITCQNVECATQSDNFLRYYFNVLTLHNFSINNLLIESYVVINDILFS